MPSVSDLKYHIVWCTKYRRDILIDGAEEEVKRLLRQKCLDNGYDIYAIESMSDHVHVFLGGKPQEPVHKMVAQLKGYTAHHLKKKYSWFSTRVPNIWTRSYFVSTVGNVTQEAITNYIKNQRNVNGKTKKHSSPS